MTDPVRFHMTPQGRVFASISEDGVRVDWEIAELEAADGNVWAKLIVAVRDGKYKRLEKSHDVQ